MCADHIAHRIVLLASEFRPYRSEHEHHADEAGNDPQQQEEARRVAAVNSARRAWRLNARDGQQRHREDQTMCPDDSEHEPDAAVVCVDPQAGHDRARQSTSSSRLPTSSPCFIAVPAGSSRHALAPRTIQVARHGLIDP